MSRVCSNRFVKGAVLCLLVGGVAFAWELLWREYDKALANRFSRQIDSYLPDLRSLGSELLRNRVEAARFLAYYHLIDREEPGTAGVYEMLGYCYYYSGDPQKAVEYYEKALTGSGSFVALYNLGVVYYKKEVFEKAAEYFQEAIALPEIKAAGYVMSAKVFSQFRVAARIDPDSVLAKVKQGYGDAARFIGLCLQKQGKSRELLFLAARYKDLLKSWTENNGQPATLELIIF